MSSFRIVLSVCFAVLCAVSCSKNNEEFGNNKNSDFSEELIKNADGKVIIASVPSQRDEKDELISAVKEVPEKGDDLIIFASAAKEEKASESSKLKPILKDKKTPNKKKTLVATSSNKSNEDILSSRQKNKVYNKVGKVEVESSVVKPEPNVDLEKVADEEPSVTYQVDTFYFNNGGSKLDNKYMSNVREIVKLAKQNNATIYILGYASSRTGDMDYVSHKMANFNVSLARAENVADAFVKAGMKREKVLLEALSDSRPVYLEVMPEGERLNRRVEIFIGY